MFDGTEFEFAEIIARNFPEYNPPIDYIEETIVNHVTIAYIPGVGRLDMIIIPEGDVFYG
ncbi:MAG: hypothetical protein CL508_05180 [Actinobacteria bacterium]|nr:hypothetical protein [Actinomycetota bacterium]|tara:strand:- start:15900 stop:16079 length:180 start_codon:yes stop_codon:yes gene_type:complete